MTIPEFTEFSGTPLKLIEAAAQKSKGLRLFGMDFFKRDRQLEQDVVVKHQSVAMDASKVQADLVLGDPHRPGNKRTLWIVPVKRLHNCNSDFLQNVIPSREITDH